MTSVSKIPELDPTDPQVLSDPFTAYGRAREVSPLARLGIPGLGPMWVFTRHEGARAMLADPRFELRADSFMRPDVPPDCVPFMRTMQEMNGLEHGRLRKLVAPVFSVTRAAELRPRIEWIVEGLLDDLAEHAADAAVDLARHFAQPLPIEVICELVGIPAADRPQWRKYGAAVAAGFGQEFADAIPAIMADAKAAIAHRRAEPGNDLISDLIRIQSDDGDRLSDTDLVTLVWHLVLAGQNPAVLISNAVQALLDHPDQLATLRANPELMPGAVEELIRWCGPQLLTIPRYARETVEFEGVLIGTGAPVTASILAANRDPRVFAEPDRLDVTRTPAAHLGFAHGPHYCLGAALGRTQTEIALTALLRRFPDLAFAAAPERALDGGCWRLAALPIRLS